MRLLRCTFEATSLMVKLFCEWASTIAKIVRVIQYTISYGPNHEWASISAQVLRVIQYNINYGPIHEWESIFAKLLRVIKYNSTL